MQKKIKNLLKSSKLSEIEKLCNNYEMLLEDYKDLYETLENTCVPNPFKSLNNADYHYNIIKKFRESQNFKSYKDAFVDDVNKYIEVIFVNVCEYIDKKTFYYLSLTNKEVRTICYNSVRFIDINKSLSKFNFHKFIPWDLFASHKIKKVAMDWDVSYTSLYRDLLVRNEVKVIPVYLTKNLKSLNVYNLHHEEGNKRKRHIDKYTKQKKFKKAIPIDIDSFEIRFHCDKDIVPKIFTNPLIDCDDKELIRYKSIKYLKKFTIKYMSKIYVSDLYSLLNRCDHLCIHGSILKFTRIVTISLNWSNMKKKTLTLYNCMGMDGLIYLMEKESLDKLIITTYQYTSKNKFVLERCTSIRDIIDQKWNLTMIEINNNLKKHEKVIYLDEYRNLSEITSSIFYQK